jgi:hypothetical protein
MRTLLFTVAIGDAAQAHYAISRAGLEGYAATYGMDFRAITEAKAVPSPHWVKATTALLAFGQGYECVIYFDADGILFDHHAPDIRVGLTRSGIHMFNELPVVEQYPQRGDIRTGFADYCKKQRLKWDGNAYYSSGVFVAFPDAEPILSIKGMPQGCYEQHAINANCVRFPNLAHGLAERWNFHRMQDPERLKIALDGGVSFAHLSGIDGKGNDNGISLMRRLDKAREVQKRNSRVEQPWEVFNPPADETPAPRLCFVTVAIGDKFKWLFDITIPSQQEYCRQYGIAHIIVDETWRRGNEHPCAMKARTYDLLVAGLFDRACYIDADIWCNPNAPNIFDEVPPGMLGQYEEGYHWRSNVLGDLFIDFPDYCEHYNEKMRELGLPEVDYRAWDRKYYNAGLFVCDKDTCPHLPPVGGIMHLPHRRILARGGDFYDQHYCNLMRIKHGFPMHELHRKWDAFRTMLEGKGKPQDQYFVHYAGQEIHKRQILSDNLPKKRTVPMPSAKPKPYRVRFIPSQKTEWIIERMWKHIIERKPEHASAIMGDREDAPDVVNVSLYRHFTRPGVHSKEVIFCTHPEVLPHFWQTPKHAAHTVVMCEQYREQLIKEELPPERVTLIYPGIDDRFRPRTLRVFNPTRLDYAMNRKGAEVWGQLERQDWLKCVCSRGRMTLEQVAQEYERADVVVSTANMEGGPMSIIEAVAMGKPAVGMKGVGFVDKFATHTYSDTAGLLHILKDMHTAKMERQRAVEALSWEAWAKAWWQVIDSVAGNTEALATQIYTSNVRNAPPYIIKVYGAIPRERMEAAKEYLTSKGYVPQPVPERGCDTIDLSNIKGEGLFAVNRAIRKQLEAWNHEPARA